MFGWQRKGLWLSFLVFFGIGLRGSSSAPSRLVSTGHQTPLPSSQTRPSGPNDKTPVPIRTLNDSIVNGNNLTSSETTTSETKQTSTLHTTVATMYVEDTYAVGNNPSTPDVTVSGEYKNMANNNSSDGQNATLTDGSQNEGSHLNLAIIPALGVLILLIIGCLKCCKCFRRYTRAGDKEDNMIGTDYAVIVQDGEEEYDYLDIKSDTTSTACYDTVSSYCSFLKRSNNSNSMTPIRQYNLDHSIRACSPRKEFLQRSLSSKDNTPMLSRHTSETEGHSETCDSVSPRSDSVLSDCPRTVSVSSEETEPLSASASASEGPEVHDNRRSQRFKVSFVMENKDPPKRSYSMQERVHNRPLSLNVQPKRPSLRKLALAGHSHLHSTGSIVQYPDNVICSKSKSTGVPCLRNEQVRMVTVATQTNRSFIYKMCRDNKRHFSESGVDGSSIPPTVKELNSPCVCTSTSEKTCNSPLSDQIQSRSSSKTAMPGNNNIERADGDTCIKMTRNERKISETDSTDDVFLSNENSQSKQEPLSGGCDNAKQQGSTSSNDVSDTSTGLRNDSEKLDREIVRKTTPNTTFLSCRCHGDLVSRDGRNHILRNDKINRHSCVARIISHGYELDRLDGKEVSCSCRNASVDKPVTIDIKRSLLYTDCKLTHVNYSVPCLRCGSYVTEPVPLIGGVGGTVGVKQLVQKTVPKLERETSLVSVELTSSTTSLESSGYAEISSESSN